jgi:hypothetical protein
MRLLSSRSAILKPQPNFSKRYNFLLLMVILYTALCCGAAWNVVYSPEFPADAGGTQLLVLVHSVLLVEIGVLIVRFRSPKYSIWPTFLLNFLILPIVPVGTVVGAYSLFRTRRLAEPP